ncbi:MAG: Tat pathway signal sequence domain protein [Acidobacteria bacterium]|nr:MAG: Tat pathway signal sequence domain protein [Acidobacteriota bacterium]
MVTEKELSRRLLMQMGISTAAASALASVTGGTLAHASNRSPARVDSGPYFERDNTSSELSVNHAYLFLDQMMDAYARGTTVRLCQSYSDQIAGGTFYSTAFVYDNALLVLAYLARARTSDIQRAKVIGDALLYAQQNDSVSDGRFRQAYFAGAPDSHEIFVTRGLPFFQGSAVGDVAWPGIALAQLYARTGLRAYLEGAVRAASFIETTARDKVNVPPGGYYFGNGQTNKSTEHNIDVYALFTMLAKLTGNGSWLDGAQHAKAFVEAMFDSPSGHFWTGTSDPTHIFYNNSPEDVQSWSYLAFQDQNFAASIDWVKTNLATTDTSFAFNNGWGSNGGLRLRVSGVTFASLSKLGTVLGDNTVDADAVWLEGTGHLIAALLSRRLPAKDDIPSFHGDVSLAGSLIEHGQVAQNSLGSGQTVNGQPLVVGQGLTASTSVLNTGFGFNYFPYFHIGATSWYLTGVQAVNPLQLADR